MPRLNPRWLFGAAAAFNLAIGLSLLLARPVLTPLLGLDPITGTNLVTYYLTASFVTVFGYAYAQIAFDLERYRPYILLGLIGKLMAIVAMIAIWQFDRVPPAVPALAGCDALFGILFVVFLGQTAKA